MYKIECEIYKEMFEDVIVFFISEPGTMGSAVFLVA